MSSLILAVHRLADADNDLQSVDNVLRSFAGMSRETRELSEIRAQIRRLQIKVEEKLPPEPPRAA